MKHQTSEPFGPYRAFPRFNMIPDCVCRNIGISATAKLVYGFLIRCAGKGKSAFPSIGAIAVAVGVKHRAAQNAVKELETLGMIRRSPRYNEFGQRSNRFYFLWCEWMESGDAESCTPSMQKTAPIKEPEEKNTLNNTDYERLARDATPVRPLSLSPIASALYTQHRLLNPQAPPPSTRIAADMMMAAKRNGMDERQAVEEFTVFAHYRIAGLKDKHLPASYRWWVVAWTNHLTGTRTALGNFRPELTEPTVPVEYEGNAGDVMDSIYGIN